MRPAVEGDLLLPETFADKSDEPKCCEEKTGHRTDHLKYTGKPSPPKKASQPRQDQQIGEEIVPGVGGREEFRRRGEQK